MYHTALSSIYLAKKIPEEGYRMTNAYMWNKDDLSASMHAVHKAFDTQLF